MTKNNFTEDTRYLFFSDGWQKDWEDGRNDANCLHHILKRISNSPYNAAPLSNFRTHQPEGRKDMLPLHCFETQSKYLKKTKAYLDKEGYIPNEKDLEFLNNNKKYYVQ